MKLALNYSPQAAELLDQSRIEFDVFKCPDWDWMIADAAKRRPVYVHFPLIAGGDNIDQVGLPNIERWLAQTDTPYVNMHLAPRAADFGVDPDPGTVERMTDAMLRDIHRLTTHFGKERVILENVYWHPKHPVPRSVMNAALIRHILDETGCGFLLDLAHACIAACQLGIDARAYIAGLPVERLCELHITGLDYDEEGNPGDHYAMTDDDWVITEWAMGQIHAGVWGHPWAVAFEYGGTGEYFVWRSRAEVIASDIPRLYALSRTVPEQ